jgi:hypothetical protein
VAHQRSATGLAASHSLKLEIERVYLTVEVLDDPQRDRNLLSGDRREVELGELLTCAAGIQASEAAGLDRDAVVKQHGADAI